MVADFHIYSEALRFVFGVFVIAAIITFIATAVSTPDDDRDL